MMAQCEGMLLEKNLLIFLFGIFVLLCPLSCRCLTLTSLDLRGMQASQVSDYHVYAAARAIDGDSNTHIYAGHCSHTGDSRQPWWKVDLGANHCLGRITLVNRGDCCSNRLSGAIIRAGIESDIFNNVACGLPVTSDQASLPGAQTPILCDPPVIARYVSVNIEFLTAVPRSLTLCEVIVQEYTMEACLQVKNDSWYEEITVDNYATTEVTTDLPNTSLTAYGTTTLEVTTTDLPVTTLATLAETTVGRDTTNQPTTTPTDSDVTTIAWCPDDIYIMEGAFVTFKATNISSSKNSVEECAITDDPSTMTSHASRECSGSAKTGAFWSDPVFIECYEKLSVNDYLNKLSKQQVTEDNVADVSLALISLTNNTSSIDSEGISSTASVLGNIISIGSPSPKVTTDVINIVNNVLQVSEDSFGQSDNSTSRMVRAVERQVSLVISNGGNFSAVTSSLAVKAFNVHLTENFREVVFSTRQNEEGDDNLEEDDVTVCTQCQIGGDGKAIDASISLPGDIFSLVNLTGKASISFTVYQNAKLFGSGRSSPSSTLIVDSRIVSASINGVTVENLPPTASIVLSFLLLSKVNHSDGSRTISRESTNQVTDDTDIHCVFWDFTLNNGIGDWSKEGCQLVSLSSRRAKCKCSHLTSFAVLMDIYGQMQSSVALDIISKIGCGVSIIALLLTTIIYLAIRSLRGKLPGRILICLSLSLLCLYTVFLLGIEQTATRSGCILVAVLIHYFTLTSLAWMAVEATSVFMFLVKVVNLGLRHFLLKASLVAWGMPLLIVTVILAVDYTQYENRQYCFLRSGGWAFLYGEIVVSALVLLYNTIIFILVLRNLYCRQRIKSTMGENQKGKAVKRIQNSVAISALLGLTWVFGLLSLFESSNFVFQVLFSVFNSLQGLLIFLMFCCRQHIRVIIMNMVSIHTGGCSTRGFRKRKRAPPRTPISNQDSKYSLSHLDSVVPVLDLIHTPMEFMRSKES